MHNEEYDITQLIEIDTPNNMLHQHGADTSWKLKTMCGQ